MNAAALFILITVTYGGVLSSSNYTTLYACKQAQSIALTGMTIEEVTEAEERRAARLAPREPVGEEEKALSLTTDCISLSIVTGERLCGTGDGKVQVPDLAMSYGTVVRPDDIKIARCFQDLGE